MKTILALSILLFVIVLPALCQTPQSSVETDIAVIKTEIKSLREAINTGFSNVQKNFDNVQKNFDNVQNDFDNVQTNFDRQNNIIIACIGIHWASLAIGATVWGILAHRRNERNHSLERQVEVLTQEIETLKQVVNP